MDGKYEPAKMPKTAKERGKIAPAKLSHVVLKTPPDNFRSMMIWYKLVLEAEAMFETDHLGFVTYDSEHHRVAILALPGTEERIAGRAGMHHMSFTYSNLGDLAATYWRLKDESGITPEYCLNHGPTTSMYYYDPDRNLVELQVDNVPEHKFAEYFANGEFAENPIGIKFDPEILFGRLAAGEPEEALLPRPTGTPPPLDEFPKN